MAKEIPYFRFYPGEWIGREITMLSMEAQGLFINICAIYWANDCDISEAIIRRRFNQTSTIAEANVKRPSTKQIQPLDELFHFGIVDVLENGNISIKFLDEQYEQISAEVEKRSNAGRLGGLASARKRVKQSLSKRSANVEQSSTYKDKYKDKDNSVGKFVRPTPEQVEQYAQSIDYDIDGERFCAYYDSKGWMVGKNKMKDWKAAVITWKKQDDNGNGQDRPLTEEEKYEQVKNRFFEYWDKTGNLKSALDNFSGSPFIKKIYSEIKKAGLKSDHMAKGPEAIPGYKELVAKLRVSNGQ